jgi:hypothetical protein
MFPTRPIFSEASLNSDKHKMERFLQVLPSTIEFYVFMV